MTFEDKFSITQFEFLAWLSGFQESFVDGSPDKDQWDKITLMLQRVNVTIEVAPTPEVVVTPWHTPPYSTPPWKSGDTTNGQQMDFFDETSRPIGM